MHRMRRSLALSLIFATRAFALDNPSFEFKGTMAPWRPIGTQTGRTQAQIVQDARHEGEQSLLLAGQDGADVMIGQTVTLPAGSLWRVRCWIKTRNLEAPKTSKPQAEESDESTPGAAVQIRSMDDSVVAEARAVSSAPDWQEVDTAFRAPAGGQFLVTLVLENGPAGSHVWFDDMHLDRLEDARFEQHVLNFPILWVRSAPYNKMLPKDANGHYGSWWCRQMAGAQIVRYWSMKTKLRCSGTYWYQRRDTKELISIDYNVPFRWDRMAAHLTRLPYTDPRVDPVADFVFRFTAGQRSQWPALPNGHPYYWTRSVEETFIRHFGFDGSSLRYIQFGEFLKTHSWNDLYDIIRKEIDEGRPIYMTLTGTKPGGHVVVLTGYRKVADQVEFTFHWSWHGAYNPMQTFRLDRPIRDFDTPTGHSMFIGIKPDTTHEQLPLYNKIAEQWDSDYDAWMVSALAWNGDRKEYAAVYPAGPKTAQRLYFQRICEDGIAYNRSFPLALRGNCRKPVIAWSGSTYGLAWEDRTDRIGTIWFTRLAPEDGWTNTQPIRIGTGAPDAWRPSVSIVYNGTEFALAWSDNGQLQFMRISAGGVPVADSKKAVAPGIDPHLVWTGDAYALAFAGNGAICLARLGRDGAIQGQVQKLFAQPNRGVYTPRVCWSGNQFGVAWEYVSRDRSQHICFVRADAECKLIRDSLVMVSDFSAPSGRTLDPAISAYKGEFVVTYCKGDAYLTRLSDKGVVLENRYLFWAPGYLTHVTSGDTANVLYLHPHGEERSVEVESCLFPLKGENLQAKEERREPGGKGASTSPAAAR